MKNIKTLTLDLLCLLLSKEEDSLLAIRTMKKHLYFIQLGIKPLLAKERFGEVGVWGFKP
ncbi:hypothetical protein [Gracilimonas sp. BCB1]|uniref:hypothetical protein n=1 Tax=Gracilimonas sp. BCB1 TaxID=3152362 RepID=UPI0032D99523